MARLVPRAIPALGLVGAPILIAFVIGMILGVTEPGTPFHVVAVMPFFIWELALGLWLTFKGFNENSPIALADRARRAQAETVRSGAGGARDRGRCRVTAVRTREAWPVPRLLLQISWASQPGRLLVAVIAHIEFSFRALDMRDPATILDPWRTSTDPP